MSANRGYQEILDILGSQCAIIPVGDPAQENAARTTVTTVGNGNGDGLVFTYSEAITAFDLGPIYQRTPLRIPEIRFNSSDEDADTPDATFWSRGDSNNDSPFSIGAWVIIRATSSVRTILGKGNLTEWQFRVAGNERSELVLSDNSAAVFPSRLGSIIPLNTPTFIVATYDGAGGASAADTINMYTNGLLINSTATNNASYDAMENLTGLVSLAIREAAEHYEGRMLGGPLGTFFTQEELTAVQVANLYDIGVQYQNAGFPPGRRRGR